MSLISQNTLHKTSLSLDKDKQHMMLESEVIPFSEVKSMSKTFTACYESGIYLGKLLDVEICFYNRITFRAKVDTRHQYDYARLYQLVYFLDLYIEKHREKEKTSPVFEPFIKPNSSRLSLCAFLFGVFIYVAFAINGWFQLYGMDVLWIEIPSIFATILLPLNLLFFALNFLWLQPSERRQRLREEILEEQAISGSLPEHKKSAPLIKWLYILSPLLFLAFMLLFSFINESLT